MAIYQGASERSRGIPFVGVLLRGLGSDAPAAAPTRPSGRGGDPRPVAGRRPAAGRRSSTARANAVATRSGAPARVAARPINGSRASAPAVRTARAGDGSALGRPVTVHHRRTFARDAALVGRRTVAVAVHRPRTAALGIAAVAAVLLTVLFYLSQLMQAQAARYELDILAQERELLSLELLSQDGAVIGLGAPETVTTWAEDRELEVLDRARHFGAR